MVYLFQRIIQNHFQWTRPSPGRLGSAGEGKYVRENGFGHEDWNFNQTLEVDGFLYGYCYYWPAPSRENEAFDIVFGTYVNGRWFVVGFYLNATYDPNPPITDKIADQKMSDLVQLGASLGSSWRKLSKDKFRNKLKEDAKSLRWKVRPVEAIRTAKSIEIPKSVFYTANYRITKPTEIRKKIFDALWSLAQSKNGLYESIEEIEFPEGGRIEVTHKTRERNPMVVTLAKRNFKRLHGKLFCQVCGFDFFQVYGNVGIDFIEGHHTVPLSNLDKTTKTKPEDIALVCSNCHRMLHKRRPWLEMKTLKDILMCNKPMHIET
jgi:predicted HNH restriction endonuclease